MSECQAVEMQPAPLGSVVGIDSVGLRSSRKPISLNPSAYWDRSHDFASYLNDKMASFREKIDCQPLLGCPRHEIGYLLLGRKQLSDPYTCHSGEECTVTFQQTPTQWTALLATSRPTEDFPEIRLVLLKQAAKTSLRFRFQGPARATLAFNPVLLHVETFFRNNTRPTTKLICPLDATGIPRGIYHVVRTPFDDTDIHADDLGFPSPQ